MELRPCPALLVAGLVLLVSVAGCLDDVTVTQAIENRPPQILLSGPDYETTNPIEAPLPVLWVLVTDADGAEDIAAVILRISNITLSSTIVRPDDPGEPCRRPFYADMDTIDVVPLLEKRTFKVANQVLGRGNGGVYGVYLTYGLLTEGGLAKHGDAFGPNVKDCRWGYDYLYMIEEFGLYPPARSSPRDVYVTYAAFSISGITFTAYDQSGAADSLAFPDFRGFFTNHLEDQTLP